MKDGKVILAVAGIFLLPSCATIVSGRNGQVTFTSNPDGATVSVDGRSLGKTPLTTILPKKEGQKVLVEKDGYKPYNMELETRLNGWFWGNLVIGGLFGSTTDSATGSMYEYSPSQYMVTLEPTTVRTEIEKGPGATDRQKVKDFVVISYRQLMDDVHAGKGPYLLSLIALLKLPASDSGDTAKKLTVLSSIYPTIPDFAEHVCDLAAASDKSDRNDDQQEVKVKPLAQ